MIAQAEDPEESPSRHAEHADHEAIGRDREEGAGLAHATQVHRHQNDDDGSGPQPLVAGQERQHGLGVLDAGRNRHRHGQHVIHQQGAGDDQTGVGAEIDCRHLVVAAAGRIGVHGLPVGHDHQEHDDCDHEGDLPGEDESRHPCQ
ncbi:hypothetical protein SDC9_179537 [bioreactor metagenome]|uniref:Uncharacterized protein n=1 Tax=bioreactor metagenome TaxID=1076179 RepID=A0A645GZ29_9ZZZZ